ncbi:MAG: hypothetical protein IJ724_14880, partial [Muribaculaceae bacterium]|nr:hypothetical protein [Muribaculaceae bacterium]
ANLTEKATNPRHIIALLKTAFMNPNVPGNIYRGYDSEYQPQERIDYSIDDEYSSGSRWGGWGIAPGVYNPNDEGLTMFLVELTDSYNKDAAVATTIKTETELVNYFKKFVKSVQLLTQSRRIEDGRNSTTGFSYSGNLSRFFLIAKGKCCSGERLSTDAPFGDAFLYEEFSPVDNNGEGGDDLYARLVAGESFPVQHDCPSVIARGHEFELRKGATDYYDVSNLLFSIPDYRLLYHDNRRPTTTSKKDYYHYHPLHQPSSVLYTVTLTAEAVPSETEGKYTVNLQWTSALGVGASVDMPQIYKLYRVVNGVVSGDPIFVGQDITSWSEEVDQLQQGYHLTYMVTAQPVDLSLPQAQSNNAQVTIPGTDPLERLVLVINGDANSVFDPATLTNTYTNHIELRNGTGNSVQGRYIEVGTTFEFYRLYSLDNELKHFADLKFTAVSARKYDYQVLVDSKQTATGSFASDTDWGDINFNGFAIVDEFAVSTADNKHPGMYKYQASFLPPANVEIPGAEGARIYSNKLEVKVFKTYATAAPNTMTQEQVDADITRPEQPLDTRVGLTLTLDNSSQLYNYALLRSDKGSWFDTGAHAQRQNSGHYMVHDGQGNSEEVTMSVTQPMMAQLIADGAMQGQVGSYDYVPIILTFPVYGEYDHYNTYGADVHTAYVSSVSVQTDYPIASVDTFTDDDEQCCYYEAHLIITPNMPEGIEPRLVRVWKFLPDGIAHETKAGFQGRLDLTQRCMLYDEPYETGMQQSAVYDYPIDGKKFIDVYDYFGGIDTRASNTEFTARYIVRVYGTVTTTSPDGTPQHGNKVEPTNGDTQWCLAESSEANVYFGSHIITSVGHVTTRPTVSAVIYYNLQGQKSNRPWQGVNLVMTQYSDGTSTTTKVIK